MSVSSIADAIFQSLVLVENYIVDKLHHFASSLMADMRVNVFVQQVLTARDVFARQAGLKAAKNPLQNFCTVLKQNKDGRRKLKIISMLMHYSYGATDFFTDTSSTHCPENDDPI